MARIGNWIGHYDLKKTGTQNVEECMTFGSEEVEQLGAECHPITLLCIFLKHLQQPNIFYKIIALKTIK